MPDLTKLTKAQLIDIIQKQEEEKFAVLKEETGLPYDTDEEWIGYINNLRAQVFGFEKTIIGMNFT